jgi:hypothetical protein
MKSVFENGEKPSLSRERFREGGDAQRSASLLMRGK